MCYFLWSLIFVKSVAELLLPHVLCVCNVQYFDGVEFPTQGIIGKRKALMRSIELREKRKRKREELEVVVKANRNTCTAIILCMYKPCTCLTISYLCVYCTCPCQTFPSFVPQAVELFVFLQCHRTSLSVNSHTLHLVTFQNCWNPVIERLGIWAIHIHVRVHVGLRIY